MKKILLFVLLSFWISAFCQNSNSANDRNLISEIDKLKNKNNELEIQISQLKYSNESTNNMIDKVDNMYNNNFNRFFSFWSIIATIVIIGIPYYITTMQKKIIEVKKKEFIDFSTAQMEILENKLLEEIANNYSQLNKIIKESNDLSKQELDVTFKKTQVLTHLISSRVNELDGQFDKGMYNLVKAIGFAMESDLFNQASFLLDRALIYKDKLLSKDDYQKTEFKTCLEQLNKLDWENLLDEDKFLELKKFLEDNIE